MPVRSLCLDDFDLAVVSEHKAIRRRLGICPNDLGITADNGIGDSCSQVEHLSAVQNDGVFDFGADDFNPFADRRVGSYVGIVKSALGANNGGPPNDAILNLGSSGNVDSSGDSGGGVDRDVGGDPLFGKLVQKHPIRLQHIVLFACIQPPFRDNVGSDSSPCIQELPDRIRDFILPRADGCSVSMAP